MPWVKIDDHFDEHPKMAAVGPLGWALWLAGLAYSNRNLTDGFIPWSVARTLVNWQFLRPTADPLTDEIWDIEVACEAREGDYDGRVTSADVISMLVQAGIWDDFSERRGYQIHDYADFQPTKAEIMAERAKKAAAGAAGGRATAAARATAPAAAESQQNPSPYPYPVPVPSNGESNGTYPHLKDSQVPVGDKELAMNGLPSLTPEAVAALQERTGRSWSQAGDRQLGEFDRLVHDYGLPAVVEAFGKVPGKTPTARQLIWSAMKVLEPFPIIDQKAAEAEERQAEIKKQTESAVQRTLRDVHFQHLTPHPLCPECPDVTPAIDPEVVTH